MIMKSTSPSEIKQLGRNVFGFDAAKWNRGKEQLMRNLGHGKFSQNHHLLQKLCSTGTLHLAECTQSDTYHGTGISISNPQCMQKNNWSGNNMLGIILMDIRKDLSRYISILCDHVKTDSHEEKTYYDIRVQFFQCKT